MYSCHTDIKLRTYCLYRHTTVLIHEILYLADQLWCSDFLTPPTHPVISHRLPGFPEYVMLLKNWCSIHARWSQSSLKHFEILQLWQLGFSRVYYNCCCSCLFEPEVIKIGQLSHKMYSNNILNFQESMTILNACTKKKVRKLVEGSLYICMICKGLDCG